MTIRENILHAFSLDKTRPQAPHMVALTCQQRNSTRSILPTSIGLLLSPPLPLGNLPIPLLLADPSRKSTGPIYLPANIYKLLSDVAIKELKKHNATTRSTPPPKRAVNTHDTDPHPEHPPTETPTGDPTPPDSPVDPDLDNTEPCEAFTFDDSTLKHLMDAYSPSYSVTKPTSIMCLNILPPIMGLLLIWEPMVALLAQM